ncbi:MAG: C39 family peptidase [Oscillospiraceae bacterium]|nr:C39 family peptidase [Oscillospiraceae bacterium]
MYYFLTIYGIVAVVGVRIYSARRFIKFRDILTKTASATLISDGIMIVLLLFLIFELFYLKLRIIMFVLFLTAFIFKLVLKSRNFTRFRHDHKLNHGFKSDYILTEGKVSFVYYNQGDCRWRDFPYSGESLNLEFTGCGPTTFAMAAATLLDDRTITPVQIAELAQDIGLNRRGTEYEFMKAAANKMNIPVKLYDTKYWNDALEEVKNGKLMIVVIHVFENLFHYIIIRHILEDGRILIADPCNFADSITPDNDSAIKKRLHDEDLPTLCVLG